MLTKKYTKQFILFIIIIILVSIIINKETNINNNKVYRVIKLEDTIQIKNLNRITYEEGFYYEDLSEELITKITSCSFPNKNTKIDYKDLKYVKVKHYDFYNNVKEGELIVNKKVAKDIIEIFYKLYENNYPINKIALPEEYNCIDELSMQDNNTSAFNYRLVENSSILSWHAFGLAIDINPLYNPYIVGNQIYPKTAKIYTNRLLKIKGMINHDDLCYKLFKEYGWSWGGDFKYTKDYQHFFKEGIYDDKIREIH